MLQLIAGLSIGIDRGPLPGICPGSIVLLHAILIMPVYLFVTYIQLCATKEGRLYLRDKNAYLILRELDRWEKVEAVAENLPQRLYPY